MSKRFGIARKLFAVCLAFGLPIVVMFVLMTKTQLAEIEFSSKEIVGDAFQRPLETVLEHISRHRRLWLRMASGDVSLEPELRKEEEAVRRALADVDAAQRAHGATLQFTPEGLGLRDRREFTAERLRRQWEALLARSGEASVAETDALYPALVGHVRTMITHAGDSSNLILDPDLDSYYLMDVTLLTLPQMEDRVQEIAAAVEAGVASGELTQTARRRFATMAAFLAEADWARVAASVKTAINEDPNFHGRSATLAAALEPRVATAAPLVARVTASLEALSARDAVAGFDIAAFRADVEHLSNATYDLHQVALDEEDRLCGKRVADTTARLHLGFALAGASVLVSSLLAFVLAANVVRRVRRISAATDAFARGETATRVGDLGSDELGELAVSFDAMTGRIGKLTEEVSNRADALAAMNGNLERLVGERTDELQHRNDAFRLILDNAHDGMLTVDMTGRISSERSAILERWFGPPRAGATFAEYIGAGNPTLEAELRLGLDEIAADVLPIELCLDQMPREIVVAGKHLRLAYEPIRQDGAVSRVLVVLSDVTSEIEGRRASARQEEILRIFHACQRDRSGFLDFFVDAREIVGKVCSGERRPIEIGRLVHTLKGNCALFGVLSMSGLCHDIETNMAEGGSGMSPADVGRLREAWSDLSTTVAQIMGEDAAGKLEVADEEYAAIVDAIAGGAPRRDILLAIARWKLEPAERQLTRFAERAKSVARRLGKEVEVSVEANDLRLCAQTWSPFWSVLAHAIRNAVDHGIEPRAQRLEVGKPAVGRLALRTRMAHGELVIEVADDGGGVRWDLVAERARAKNLPASTHRDLVEAIFTDGISTKTEVTDTSGRGVGMAAVREACEALEGAIDVESALSRGTTLRCTFPARLMEGPAVASMIARPITRTLAPAAPVA